MLITKAKAKGDAQMNPKNRTADTKTANTEEGRGSKSSSGSESASRTTDLLLSLGLLFVVEHGQGPLVLRAVHLVLLPDTDRVHPLVPA